MKIKQGNFIFDTQTKQKYPILISKTHLNLSYSKTYFCPHVVYKTSKGEIWFCLK